MIVNSDPKAWWHKVTKIVDIVDQELGFLEGSVNALFYKTVRRFVYFPPFDTFSSVTPFLVYRYICSSVTRRSRLWGA